MKKIPSKKKLIKEIDLNFYLHLPEDYDENKKWPLILFLHGISRRGNNVEDLNGHGLVKKINNDKDFPFIVISPQCPEGVFWEFLLDDLINLVDEISNDYSVDKKKIYLTGLSMGGIGTWSLAIEYPNKFAAIAPICGRHEAVEEVRDIRHIPTWVFHGAKDEVIPVERSKELVNELKKVDGNVKFTVYPEADHDSWTETYNNSKLYEWLLDHKLD